MDTIKIKTYAGILGKIFGVYSGRPIEGWTHEKIMKHYGEFWGYVPNTRFSDLVVTDDDITGTFTFLRAIEDSGYKKDISSKDVGHCWMNYIIEKKAILWWGGYGVSSEHTAYMNMKNGIQPPLSGSIQHNGKIIAEQIGAQIFIDGWGMVAANDPDLAAKFAKEAALVSHDGEAMYAAIVIAVMVSLAYSIDNMDTLLNKALTYIPQESSVAKLITELRELHKITISWQEARCWLEHNYGYDKYLGNCHVMPNHGIVILSLLWSEDSFDRAIMIANTCGWDTDCNAANVGCIMAVKKGLSAFEERIDWRSIVADQLYLPTADGGSSLSDAVKITEYITKVRANLYGQNYEAPKQGALYHFDLPGSVQAFRQESEPFHYNKVHINNKSSSISKRSLCIKTEYPIGDIGYSAYISTPTYIPQEYQQQQHYEFLASPNLLSGQVVQTCLSTDKANTSLITITLYILIYGEDNQAHLIEGTSIDLEAGANKEMNWKIPDTEGKPILKIGFKITSKGCQKIYIDYLTWEGNPTVKFTNYGIASDMISRSWISSCDNIVWWHKDYEISADQRNGLFLQGTHLLQNYKIESQLSLYTAHSAGIVGHVQGLQRYYVFRITKENQVQLVSYYDDIEEILSSKEFLIEQTRYYTLECHFTPKCIQCFIDNKLILEYQGTLQHQRGSFGLYVNLGCLSAKYVRIS